MSFPKLKSIMQMSAADNSIMLIIQHSLVDLIAHDLHFEIHDCVKEAVNAPEIRQKIEDELSRQLLSMETRSALATMISEIVAETIKSTILQMKENGLL